MYNFSKISLKNIYAYKLKWFQMTSWLGISRVHGILHLWALWPIKTKCTLFRHYHNSINVKRKFTFQDKHIKQIILSQCIKAGATKISLVNSFLIISYYGDDVRTPNHFLLMASGREKKEFIWNLQNQSQNERNLI